jgi:hypothetical protein
VVEHNLAKVGVASSNLVSRSNTKRKTSVLRFFMPEMFVAALPGYVLTQCIFSQLINQKTLLYQLPLPMHRACQGRSVCGRNPVRITDS